MIQRELDKTKSPRTAEFRKQFEAFKKSVARDDSADPDARRSRLVAWYLELTKR